MHDMVNLLAIQTHLNSSEERTVLYISIVKNYSKQILFTPQMVRYSFILPSKCDKLALKKVLLKIFIKCILNAII